MKKLRNIKYWTYGVFCCAALLSCSENLSDAVSGKEAGGEPETFTMNYILPDTETGNDRIYPDTESGNRAMESGHPFATRASVVLIANEQESKVSNVALLFFERDDYGNGLFVGRCDGTVESNHLAKSGKVAVTLADPVKADTGYNVLAIANADSYFSSSSYLADYCKDKTENRVRLLLTATMPHTPKYVCEFPDAGLPMSGTAVKEAGKDMTVSLLRAVARIDVKVADDKKDKIVLTEATLRNVSSRIPVFNDPKDADALMLASAKPYVQAVNDTVIRGGLYLPEVFRTGFADDVASRSRQAACLLVNCHNKDYTGTRTWYRIDIDIDDEGVQYLRRNNAYTVEISRIRSLGAETPDEAYNGDATLIKAVTIPTEWKTPEGMDKPPVVDIQ